jgi:hypothetical protein
MPSRARGGKYRTIVADPRLAEIERHVEQMSPLLPKTKAYFEFVLARLRELEDERERLRAALELLVESLLRTSPGHLDTPAGEGALNAIAAAHPKDEGSYYCTGCETYTDTPGMCHGQPKQYLRDGFDS